MTQEDPEIQAPTITLGGVIRVDVDNSETPEMIDGTDEVRYTMDLGDRTTITYGATEVTLTEIDVVFTEPDSTNVLSLVDEWGAFFRVTGRLREVTVPGRSGRMVELVVEDWAMT